MGFVVLVWLGFWGQFLECGKVRVVGEGEAKNVQNSFWGEQHIFEIFVFFSFSFFVEFFPSFSVQKSVFFPGAENVAISLVLSAVRGCPFGCLFFPVFFFFFVRFFIFCHSLSGLHVVCHTFFGFQSWWEHVMILKP